MLNAVQMRIGLTIAMGVMRSRGGANSLTECRDYDYRRNERRHRLAFCRRYWGARRGAPRWRPSSGVLQVTAKRLTSFMAVRVEDRGIALALVPKVCARLAFLCAKLHRLTRLKKGGAIFQDTPDGETWHDSPPTGRACLTLATMSRADILPQLSKRHAERDEHRRQRLGLHAARWGHGAAA